MGFLIGIWNGIKDGLELVLRFYEGLLEPFMGQAAWGVSIVLLTVTVRVFMIPLMVRQTKSMRAMQTVQPELKKIQEKYKADRSMMKTDPERYKKIKEKQREAQMELYQEHGVNPVGGCLPLLLQMPVFLALFQVLQDEGPLRDDLASATFLGIGSLTDTARGIVTGGEGGVVIGAAIAALGLIILQVGTTYWSQKQMMARNTNTAAAEQAQVQKIMLYVMPVFLGYLSFTFPIGVVLYWVTTNLWTMGQQAIIFRNVEAQEAKRAEEREAAKKEKKTQSTGDEKGAGAKNAGAKNAGAKNAGAKNAGAKGPRAKGPTGQGGKGSAGKGSAGKDSGGNGKGGADSAKGGHSKGDDTGRTGGNGSGNGRAGSTPPADDTTPPRRPTRRSRPSQDGPDGGATTRNGRPPTGGPAGSAASKRSRPKDNRSKPGSR